MNNVDHLCLNARNGVCTHVIPGILIIWMIMAYLCTFLSYVCFPLPKLPLIFDFKPVMSIYTRFISGGFLFIDGDGGSAGYGEGTCTHIFSLTLTHTLAI